MNINLTFFLIGILFGIFLSGISYYYFSFFINVSLKKAQVFNINDQDIRKFFKLYVFCFSVILSISLFASSKNAFADNVLSEFLTHIPSASTTHKVSFGINKVSAIEVYSGSKLVTKSNIPLVLYVYAQDYESIKTLYSVSATPSDGLEIPKGKKRIGKDGNWIIKSKNSTPNEGILTEISYTPPSPNIIYVILPY